MRIPGSLMHPARALPVPQEQSSLADKAQTLLPSQLPASTQTVRAVVGAREAEAMLLRTHPRPAVYQAQAGEDLRSHRALEAYGALEQNVEREYVSAVLGIDVYA